MKYEATTKSEMAHSLGLSLRTFQRRLKHAGLYVPRGLINTDTQTKIFLKLGYSIKLKNSGSKRLRT